MPIFERIRGNGERYVPHRFKDGRYRVADPTNGKKKHHASHQIPISYEEIVDYLRKGFYLRMRGERTGQSNLIAASKITIRD